MKTIQKVLSMSVATLISIASFGQLSLGVQSTTNAAVNAAVNSGVIVQSTQAVTNSARATTSMVVGKAMDTKSTASGVVNANAGTTVTNGTSIQADVKPKSEASASGRLGTDAGVRGNSDTRVVQKTTPAVKTKAETGVSAEIKSETQVTVGGQ